MADYPEHGEVATTVTPTEIKLSAEEQMSKIAGRSEKLSPQIELGTATVSVNADGRNTQAVQATVKLPKLKAGEMLESDMKPTVESKVDNDKLGKMLTASGYADMAQDLNTVKQAMKLDNAGGMEDKNGKMTQDPRLAHRMNMMHRKSAGIFGLAAPGATAKPGQPKLDDINKMKPAQVASLVKTAQQNNPDLAGKDLSQKGPNNLPKAVNELNAQKLKDKELAMKNPDNVEKITIGMTGLNFKQSRKNVIERTMTPQVQALDPNAQKPQLGNRKPTPQYAQSMPRTGLGNDNSPTVDGQKPQPTAAKLAENGQQIQVAPPKSGLDVVADTLENAAKPAPKANQKLVPPTAKMAMTPSTAPKVGY